jgi:hypothetical protein
MPKKVTKREPTRTHSLRIALNSEEYELMFSAYKRSHFHTLSDYARACILRRRIPPAIPEVNQYAYTELNRIGANLHYLIQQLWTSAPDSHSIQPQQSCLIKGDLELTKLFDLLETVQRQLVGSSVTPGDTIQPESAD